MATSFGVRGCPGSANRSRSGWRQRLSTKGAACAILGGGHTGDRREILGSSEGDQRERRDGRHLGTAERAAASSLVHKDGEGDHHVDKSNGLTCGERGTHTRSEAVIRGHQRPLEAIRSHQRSSEVRPSEAVIKRTQQAIRGHQRPSSLLRAVHASTYPGGRLCGARSGSRREAPRFAPPSRVESAESSLARAPRAATRSQRDRNEISMGLLISRNQAHNQAHTQGRSSAAINLACTSWSVEQATVFLA